MKSAAILAVAVLAASADAHGVLTLPKPSCKAGYCSNSPSGTIDGPSTIPVPSGMSYGTDPQSNTNAYLKGFAAQTKYKTLKDLATSSAVKLESGSTLNCGFADENATPQPLPDTVQWDKFDLSHMGPCEVWCDDEMVFQDDQCSVHFTTQPAVLKYDKSKCVGKKLLQSYWIALHVPLWQIYTGCAPIAGGGSSSGGSTTPAATSKSPAATSKAPSATSKSPSATSKAPSATTKAPAATQPAGGDEYDDEYATPAPTPAATKKCKAKARRN